MNIGLLNARLGSGGRPARTLKLVGEDASLTNVDASCSNQSLQRPGCLFGVGKVQVGVVVLCFGALRILGVNSNFGSFCDFSLVFARLPGF